MNCWRWMLPTHVGMNQGNSFSKTLCLYAPHARGDEPTSGLLAIAHHTCSPRTWG